MANWQRAVMKAMRIKNYPVTVLSVQDITGFYRRITFASPEATAALAGFPTEWVRIWVPESAGAQGKIVQRGYTLTRLDHAAGQFDLEFVLHDVPGAAGDWAKSVTAGYQTEISLTPAEPKLPENASRMILAGDLTALPAINSWLGAADQLGVERIEVLLEDAHGPGSGLPQGASDKLHSWTWAEPTPVLGTALAESLESALEETAGVYVWGAGEKDLVKRLRTVLKLKGLGKESYFTQFYWIKGKDFG